MQPGNKQGHLETQQVQVWSLHTTMEDQTGFQSPESQLTSQTTQASKPSTPELQSSLQCLSVSAAQHSSLKHVLVPKEQRVITCKSSETPLISTAALQRLKIVEDKTAQVNTATVPFRYQS